MTVNQLPAINASLNVRAAVLLTLGFRAFKRHNRLLHKRYLLSAFVGSALFLQSYLIHHNFSGATSFPRHDWTMGLYFVTLISLIILAVSVLPFFLTAFVFALRGKFKLHINIVSWDWPVWMYVSVTGVVICYIISLAAGYQSHGVRIVI